MDDLGHPWAKRAALALTLALAVQPSTARASDMCGSAEVHREGISFGLLSQQDSSRQTYFSYLHLDVRSSNGKFQFSVGYQDDGHTAISPKIWFIESKSGRVISDQLDNEIIRWRTETSDWQTSAYAASPDNLQLDSAHVRYSWKIAQSDNSAWHSGFNEASLASLQQGGRYSLKRIAVDGTELDTGVVDYPSSLVVKSLYEKAKVQAIAKMTSCKPPILAYPVP